MIEALTRTARYLDWHEAASLRVSRRRFDGSAATDEQLAAMAAHCRGFRPFDDARAELITSPPTDVFKGILGSYGKVSGAPHILLMIAGDPDSVTSDIHTGYTGEAAILEATRLKLDTCWVAGFFDRKKAETLTSLAPGERILAVSPLGRGAAAITGAERTMRTMAKAQNRKSLDEIAPGYAVWPAWARSAVECARIAPSAMNRQPWRFAFTDDTLVISQDSAVETPKVTKALDCGIAMLHAQLGAAAAGVAGTWTTSADRLEIGHFSETDRHD